MPENKKFADKTSALPEHVAVIMDGNGRWATERGLKRSEGHKEGAKKVSVVANALFNAGVKTVSLYALSEENFSRPQDEITGILERIEEFIAAFPKLFKEGSVRLRFLGSVEKAGEPLCSVIGQAEKDTLFCSPFTLNILLGYGGRAEIIRAARLLSEKNEEFTAENFEKELYTSGLSDPDLIIRTGGEKRLSGFMPYQSTYSELYFCDTLFPDFGEEDISAALSDYSGRNRRFGKI